MSDHSTAIEVLNELLRVEHASLLSHFHHSTPFIGRDSAEQDLAVRGMLLETREHEGWLIQAIVSLKGGVAPAAGDMRAAGIHYQELHRLLPTLIENEVATVARYESAIRRLTGEASTAVVASRILARHRDHLQQLRAMLAGSSRKPSSTAGAPA